MLRLLAQSQLSGMRVKEVLYLLVGYAMGHIEMLSENDGEQKNSCLNTDKKEKISMQSKMKLFTQQLSKNIFVTKKYLVTIFSTVIDIFKSKKIFLLQKTQGQVFEIFQSLVIEGLKVFQHQRNQIHQILQIFFEDLVLNRQKLSEIQNQKKEQKKPQQQKQVQTLEYQNTWPKSQKFCQICMYSLNVQLNSLNNFIKISKCQHQFHRHCIVQMIKQHLHQKSDIIFYSNKYQASSQKDFKYEQTLTKIKCPNFQQCSVYLTLYEIHNFIVNLPDDKKGQLSQNNKDSQILNKIYSQAFDQYLINKIIRSFEELHQKFKLQKNSINENQSVLFYCKTPGCNAIYEIDKKIQKNKNNDSGLDKKPNKFICLSCKQSFCLQCFSSLHPTMTCKQHLISASTLPQDQQLQKFIKTLKKPYKKCPKCRFYVDNWRGCSTVKCRCGTQFCFKCGNIGCPHAKCLKQIEKEEKQKLLKEKQDKDKQKEINK